MIRQFITLILMTGALAAPASAERYLEIRSTDTLADLKTRFPGANFVDRKPAWATAEERLFSVTGKGIAGEIIVKFRDPRPYFEEQSRQDPEDEFYKELASKPEDVSLRVMWVRWVPTNPIPLARLVSKYGSPTESGYSDEDLSPFRRWKRGLYATLSDDEKMVLMIDYYFTPQDECEDRRADSSTDSWKTFPVYIDGKLVDCGHVLSKQQ